MFAFLRGKIALKKINQVALDVKGIGFDVLVPDLLQNRLTVGEEVTLLTYCHIREDSFQIFGFSTEKERSLFTTCITISGVGPKVALALLSTLSVDALIQAVQVQNIEVLTRVPGVGKKLAGRIILEMTSKMGKTTELSALLGQPEANAPVEGDDVYEALISLGCSIAEARNAATHARKTLGEQAADADLVREALRSLAKVNHGQR